MGKAKIEIFKCDISGYFSNNLHVRSSRGQNCWQVQWFFRRFFLQKWGLQFDQTSETQLANRHAKYIVRKEAWDVGYHVHFCRAFRWKAFENEGWIRSPRQLKSFNRTMKSLGSIAFCAFQKASFLYSKSASLMMKWMAFLHEVGVGVTCPPFIVSCHSKRQRIRVSKWQENIRQIRQIVLWIEKTFS